MGMVTVARVAAPDRVDLAAADLAVAPAAQAEVPAVQEKVTATDRRLAAAAVRVAPRAAAIAGLPGQRAKAAPAPAAQAGQAPATRAARVALILELAAVRVLRDRPVKVIAVRPVKAARAVTVRPAMAGIASNPPAPRLRFLRNVPQEFWGTLRWFRSSGYCSELDAAREQVFYRLCCPRAVATGADAAFH
jgi:hypothetical protein